MKRAMWAMLGATMMAGTVQAAERPAITGISHIAVYSADAAATEQFYKDRLGAEKLPDPEDARGVRYRFSARQFVEVLPLEEHHWKGLIELLGNPEWAQDPALKDPIERGKHHGAMINRHVRAFAATQKTHDFVQRAQKLGVPMAPYNAPADVLADPHEKEARVLFQPVEIPDVGKVATLVSPFHFDGAPLPLTEGPPRLGQHQNLLRATDKVLKAGAA